MPVAGALQLPVVVEAQPGARGLTGPWLSLRVVGVLLVMLGFVLGISASGMVRVSQPISGMPVVRLAHWSLRLSVASGTQADTGGTSNRDAKRLTLAPLHGSRGAAAARAKRRRRSS